MVAHPGAPRRAVAVAMEILGGIGQAGAPLGARTTYRVGGPAAVLATARDLTDLGRVAAARRASGLPVLVVGRGSNLLVADRGFPGIAVVLDPAEDAFGWVRIEGTTVEAGAATPLPTLARRSVEAGLTGFEWAVGVPGSVGGAVRMNAGGHGSDMAASTARALVADLDAAPAPGATPAGGGGAPPGGRPEVATAWWTPERLAHGYRRSALSPTDVVCAVTLRLSRGDRDAGLGTIRAIVRWRREHQPGGQNAGSVFTNPVGAPPPPAAGRLVESAGLKGARQGSAEVSTKHANFIQADPGGSADDVDSLIERVASEVRSRFGIDLHTELRRIGFDPEPVPDSSTPDRPDPQREVEG